MPVLRRPASSCRQNDSLQSSVGAGNRVVNMDVGNGGHTPSDIDRDVHGDGESDWNGGLDDDSDERVNNAAARNYLDVVLCDSGDHNSVLKDKSTTTLDLSVFVAISNFPYAPNFCLFEEVDFSASELDTDDKDMLQAEAILFSSTMHRS